VPIPELAYVIDSLAGAPLARRLRWAADLGIAAEVANRTLGSEFDERPYREAGVPIVSVQAHAMHEVHPLHPHADIRARADAHVRDTVALAARLGARYVVTVCGFGPTVVDEPFERSRAFFAGLAPWAESHSVQILVEPLSPLRCAAMTDPHEVARLLEVLDDPIRFGLLLDTGHLLDSGLELAQFFASWTRPVAAVQLKGPASAPPTVDLTGSWLQRLQPAPAVLSVEHRQPLSLHAAGEIVTDLKRQRAHDGPSMS
jgi:sugar phosphate isomerase/epimerase